MSAGVAPGCWLFAAIWLSDCAIWTDAHAFEVGVGILLLPLPQKLHLLHRVFFFCDRLGEVVFTLVFYSRRFGRGSLSQAAPAMKVSANKLTATIPV